MTSESRPVFFPPVMASRGVIIFRSVSEMQSPDIRQQFYSFTNSSQDARSGAVVSPPTVITLRAGPGRPRRLSVLLSIRPPVSRLIV